MHPPQPSNNPSLPPSSQQQDSPQAEKAESKPFTPLSTSTSVHSSTDHPSSPFINTMDPITLPSIVPENNNKKDDKPPLVPPFSHSSMSQEENHQSNTITKMEESSSNNHHPTSNSSHLSTTAPTIPTSSSSITTNNNNDVTTTSTPSTQGLASPPQQPYHRPIAKSFKSPPPSDFFVNIAANLSYSAIAQYFRLPLHEACVFLHVDESSLKKRCRELGIRR